MDDALVNRIPSRLPYFFMLVVFVFIFQGTVQLAFRYQLRCWNMLMSAMGWQRWNPKTRGKFLRGSKDDDGG
jgi:hypothetical protein